ncbi:hypothetical protein BaRGS_00005292 [Batillaria attramentaria]|uniref:protein-tyrosine-phosphatase n=1 Tax=Batillaria attramentaria TaxID=370345 RepID=A0ABD0LW87_9CAEN
MDGTVVKFLVCFCVLTAYCSGQELGKSVDEVSILFGFEGKGVELELIRLTNTRITVDDVECHSIGSTPPPRQYSFTCNTVLYGQRVRITRSYRQYNYLLNVCEVEILVLASLSNCNPGYWGPGCSETCNNCGGESGAKFCYQDTGDCFSGCVAGRYGSDCSQLCDISCRDSVCNQDTGSCPYQTWLIPSTITVDGVQCYRYDTQFVETRTPTCAVPVTMETTVTHDAAEATACTVIRRRAQTVMYGNDCSLQCLATSCANGQCDVVTGLCTQCDGNYDGPYCADCSPGYYGASCSQQCRSSRCLNNVCDRQYGWCLACPPGSWNFDCGNQCPSNCKDSLCDKDTGRCLACSAGFWGDSCDQSCSAGCQSNECDQQTGHCQPCDSSYWGAKCDQMCAVGCPNRQCDQQTGYCQPCNSNYWGDRCDQQCSTGCLNSLCVQETGRCLSGCRYGYWGDFCNETCLSSRCRNKQCNQTNGLCLECRSQYFELPYCECVDGRYYVDPYCDPCPAQCYNNTPCDKTTGYCDSCPPGKRGNFCGEACQIGTYGQDCRETCGQCSSGETTCNSVNGECINCKPGWKAPYCKVCEDGKYGQNCTQTCGQCSNGAICDKETGHCPSCPTARQKHSVKTAANHAEPVFLEQPATPSLENVPVDAQAASVDHYARSKFRRIQEEAAGTWAPSDLPWDHWKRKTASKSTCGRVRGEVSESRNGDANGSPLSFDPIVISTTDKTQEKPKAAVKPQVKAKPSRTPLGKGAIYENVAIGQAALSSQAEPASSAQPPKDKKGKQPKTKSAGESVVRDDAAEDVLTDDELKEDGSLYANEDMYSNVDPASLSLDTLQRQVLNKLKALGKLETEFQKIPPIDEKAPKVNGEREENNMKNRFKSILPYDRNRVVLEKINGDDASDYINASFVRGHRSDKAYIAAQGPKNNTAGDFWRMVWQEQVTHIVMLTNLLEHNKWKCYEYWPAKGAKMTYGTMEVTGVDDEQRAHYVIRTFDVSQAGDREKRRVQQFHYVSWFDHEVPATTPLVDFWRHVKARASCTSKSPLLVHCSAGVGRTGTFIALDVVIDRAQHEANVIIRDVVQRLRDDRCNMVQNKGQYLFLHEAVLEAYTSLNTRLDLTTFESVFDQPVQSGSPNQRIDKEFEALRQMRSCFSRPVYHTAVQDENRAKNRNPNALPDDRHLVYLTPHVRGRNQYINAVYMSTFRESRGSIMTQLPLPDTLMDIWRLVDGCQVNTIVSLGDADIQQDGSSSFYWPRHVEDTVRTGLYTVTLKSLTKLGSSFTRYNLSLELQDQTDTRSVEVFHYEDWSGEVPSSTTDMLQLLDSLGDNTRKQRAGHPLLVQCIDGAAKSGLFCALHDVISRVTQDQEVDVYLAVRHVHSVRPEAIPSVEQYRYCYELLQQHRNSQNIYANA